MPRRFGPTLGAGVVVVETDSDKAIQPAPTGVTLYVGQTLKGDVGELISCPSKGDFTKKVGGFFEGSQLPDAAFDFWNLGRGAGELFVVRITDGAEVAAAESFHSRHIGGTGTLYTGVMDQGVGFDEVKRALVTVTAKNGGRWGGRTKTKANRVAVVGTDITATTLITGETFLPDEWKGATLYLNGVTVKTYEVVSNTAAGVVTVKSDQNMAADLAAGSDPTDAGWALILDSEILLFPTSIAGTRRALSITWKDGEEDEVGLFGIEVYEDEVKVLDYPNLSLDLTNKWYAPTVVNNDTSNFWITLTNLFSGTVTSDIRPANWFGHAVNWSSDVVTVEIVHTAAISSTNPDVGWVDTIELPGTPLVRKGRIRITFTSATAFTVTTIAANGVDIETMGTGTVDTQFTSQTGKFWTIKFTVHRGQDAWTSGDTIDLDVLPLPVDNDGEGLLVGGFLYVDAAGDARKKVAIKSNTSDTITLVTAPTPTPTEALAAPASEFFSTGTLVFPFTVSPTTLELAHSFFGRESLTISAGPHATAVALAAAINTAWQTASSSVGNIAAAVGDAIRFSIDSSGADTHVGLASFLRVLTAHVGLNLAVDDHVAGSLGDFFRVQARTELRGGYDGQAPDAADFVAAAASPPDTLFARVFGQNKGLVKIATPGQTDTTLQKAYLELASFFGYQYRVEIPSGTTDDSAAVAYINDTIGRNDFGVTIFPSYANVPNPAGAGTVLRTLTGAVHGREALVAKNFQGYHKAAAGIDVTLPNVVELPTGDRILNEEVLNPQGLNIVKKARGNFVIWGDRTIALDPAWKFKHQREQMSHYERQLLEGFDFIIFAINDKATQADLITTLTIFFLPEFQKRALRGDTFADAVSIKIDDSNNTNLTRAAGDLNAEIKLRLADTVERFVIRIGKAGVFEDLG